MIGMEKDRLVMCNGEGKGLQEESEKEMYSVLASMHTRPKKVWWVKIFHDDAGNFFFWNNRRIWRAKEKKRPENKWVKRESRIEKWMIK